MESNSTNRRTVGTESRKAMVCVNVPVDLLVTAFGIGLMVLVGSYLTEYLRDAVPLHKVYEMEQAGDEYVNFDVNYMLDAPMESYHTRNGMRAKSSMYYLVLDEEAGAVPVCISGRMEAEMDRTMDETWDYSRGVCSDPPQGSHVEGTLRKLKGDGKKYYNRAVRSSDLKTETEGYYFWAGILDNQIPSSAMGTTNLGAVITFPGLLIPFSMLKRHHVAAVWTFLDSHKTMNRERLGEDFRNARKVGSTSWVGEGLIHGIVGRPMILVNQEPKKVRFQVKKVKRGASMELVCVMADGGEYESMMSRKDVNEAIALYHAKFPTLKMTSSLKGKLIVPEDGDTESN